MRTWRQAQDEAERQHRFTEAASLGIGVHWYDEPDFRKSRYAADEWRCQSLFAASAAMTHMEQTRRFRSMTPEEWHAASRRGERMYAHPQGRCQECDESRAIRAAEERARAKQRESERCVLCGAHPDEGGDE